MNKSIFSIILINLFFFSSIVNSKIINEIIIKGNDRISNETIIMFSDIEINQDFDDETINNVLKNLYESNFFENVTVESINNSIKINVIELPIIQEVEVKGLKAKKNNEFIRKNLILKPRSSFNEYLFFKDKEVMMSKLRELGFYFAKIDTFVEELENNQVNIIYDIDVGKKAKIKKISFIGDKIYKNSKLRNIIISEEYKFWKFISGRKFLNEDIIATDQRLLKNFYLNKGYYNVDVNASFAKLVNDDEFELVFNIKPKEKIYFRNLTLNYPNDYEGENFSNLSILLKELKGDPYSIYSVEKILNEIDFIALNEEYKSVNAFVEEKIILNQLDLDFVIEETEKYSVEKINIFGNNITRESVIRNQLEVDEGDPYNEILKNKSTNNIKNLNFFKYVKTEVTDGSDDFSKIININVKEKATGEISAGAGVGTSGGTLAAGVKENNYLGKGLAVEINGTLTAETFKGLFSVTNPNYNNSDKLVFANMQAIEIDQIKNFGYKTNKTGFELGAQFEYYKDLDIGLSTRSFYEKIATDSTASARQKKQEGNYWDTFFNFSLNYDKRNQKFRPSDGFVSGYTMDVPVISKTNTLTNSYDFKIYTELYENNISSFSLYLQSANSLTGDDVKLTERLTISSRKLRGFESGKVGPKDGNDFIGGNYLGAINVNTTIPQLFQNFQNLDASIFFDAANVWGVDYDSSLNNSGKIRSSIGIGVDWFSIIGPINFTLAETITKDTNDITESFRFNIGTTF